MELLDIIPHFCFSGNYCAAEVCGNGHINETHTVSFRQPDDSVQRYILQRVNRFVFHQPEEVIENVERVTRHLGAKIRAAGGDPARETLTLVPAQDGRCFYRDEQGETWRAYLFIEGARTYETAESAEQVYHAAWAYGNFQRQLADFPANQLHETIPNFHHTPLRFAAFVDVVRRDPFNRAAEVREDIRFIAEREADTRVLVEGIAQGVLPLRVTHNDTKFNNVLIDERTGRALCVIDLDTVMPGLALYDFGDAVRTACALISEDTPDWSRAGMSLDTFTALAHGYLDAARDFLTEAEMDALAFSARLITLEQAIRFLTDHLNGDKYYRIHRPGHNLDRARTQITMLKDMEAHFAQMRAIISGVR
jgi:Ser/Thr protein kinase RdoA (MazF antagonist)